MGVGTPKTGQSKLMVSPSMLDGLTFSRDLSMLAGTGRSKENSFKTIYS